MISYRHYITGLLIVATLTGCAFEETKSAPSPASPNTFTANLMPLDSIPTGLTELATLKSTGQSGPVWAIQYSINKNNVFAAYGDDGRVVEWSLNTKKAVATYNLGIVSPKALQFNEDGMMILGATGSVYKESEYTRRPVEYLTGIAVWSTETGELIRCLSLPCFESPSESAEGEVGALIDPTGQLVFIYDEYLINIRTLSGDRLTQGFCVNSPDSEYWWNISHIAYDPLNQRYAIIYQEGLIELRNLIQSGPIHFAYTLADGNKNDLSDVKAAMFDPGGNRLAFIRDDRLSIWNIGKNSGTLFFDKEISTAFSLLFDPTGKFLFISSNDKITILDVAQKSVVAEYSSPKITDFDISNDNRLLTWGDENGVIHIWGISKAK